MCGGDGAGVSDSIDDLEKECTSPIGYGCESESGCVYRFGSGSLYLWFVDGL